MSELKATPGPWRVNQRQIIAPLSDESRGGLVATCRGSAQVRTVANANARLIAAAPDLYEALRILMVSYESLAHDYQYAVGAGDIHPMHAEYIQRSDDALRKARGES